MKKISVIFFAAIAMLTVASCSKEELVPGEAGFGNGKNITATVTLSDDSKTSIADDGKTVTWMAGDSLLITDGSAKVAVFVPDEADGEKTASFTIDATKVDVTKPLYAVYPYMAYSKIDGGNIVVSIPSDQSGMFEEAHICVAKMSEDFNFAMKNVSAIFKIDVADNIQTLMISGGDKDTLAANLTVTYTDASTPVSVKETSPVKSIRLVPGTLGGAYYVAVAPGTYSADLSMMAITPDGQSEKVSATKTHTLAIGDIADLGRIGDSPAGAKFDGEGSEEFPYLIKTQADMTVLATAVNNGVDYAGTFFKVTDNISGVEIPVGTYDGVDFYFKGDFNGDGHTLTLAMGGEDSEESYLALFGELGEGAHIHNLIVAGSVKTTSDCVAGIASVANGGKEGILIENCTNKASVSGKNEVAGIVGYGDGATKIVSCTNTGAITGVYATAGIAAYCTSSIAIESCTNSGAITATDAYKAFYVCAAGVWKFALMDNTTSTSAYTTGVGGIAGWFQNASMKDCTNNGPVTGTFKVGGVVGSAYWSKVENCNNSATITASEICAGGVVAWGLGHCLMPNCSNTGKVIANSFAGGVLGFADYVASNSAQGCQLTNCTNSGEVHAIGGDKVGYYNASTTNVGAAGGIVGGFYSGYNANNKRAWLSIKACRNSGAVTADQLCAGGLLGAYFGISNCNWDVIETSINSGDVTAKYWAGGLLGYWNGRWNYDKTTIKNCGNTGTVLGTRTAEDGSNCVIGGLVGGSYVTYNGTNYANYGVLVSNCYNHGDVIYANDALKTVYAGGLTGFNFDGTYTNCYTSGKVTSSTETVAEGATFYAALIANLAGKGAINTCYYLDGIAPLAIGEGSTIQPGNYVVPFKFESGVGTFDAEKPGYGDSEDLLTALNAWAEANSMTQWKASPDGPVLDL